jgi:hypothetical protein
VPLHRVVGGAARLPEGGQTGALGVGGDEIVGSRDDRASISPRAIDPGPIPSWTA